MLKDVPKVSDGLVTITKSQSVQDYFSHKIESMKTCRTKNKHDRTSRSQNK